MRTGWTYKKLGEVCDVVTGSTPKTNEPSYWGGTNYWVTPAELKGNLYVNSTERTITEEAVKNTNLTLMPIGTVLLSSRAPIGKVAITKVPMYCNQGFKNLICKETIYNKYLFWFLWGKTDFLNSLGRGATFKEISKSIVERIQIPLPPIPQQRLIVSELDEINSLISLKREQLKKYDELAQSLFYEMFGDPVENEKGWEVKKLGDVGEIATGSTPTTSDKSNWNGHINWVTPAELGVQLYYGETVRKITEKGAKGLTVMPRGTVLLSSRAPIGKLAITTVEMCCNQGFKNIICGSELNNIYAYYYLLLVMDKIVALGRGATFKEVSKSSIQSFSIPLPPLSLQRLFAQRIEQIEEQKKQVTAAIAKLETLLASRMQYWFE